MAGMLEELGEDHRTWLLVAANNFLGQRQADRAIVLLELLDLLDPHDTQCQKMLAYAHWLRDDPQRSGALIERVLRQPLTDEDRAAMRFMNRCLRDAGSALMPPAGIQGAHPEAGPARSA